MKRGIYMLAVTLALCVATPARALTLDHERIFDGVNAERAAAALPAFERDPALDRIAMEKAHSIFATQEFAHDQSGKPFFSFFDDAHYEYAYAGENLAMDYFNEAELVRAWMDSPAHRANVLDTRYTAAGIAVLDGILHKQYTVIVVQVFARPAAASAGTHAGAALTSIAGSLPVEAGRLSLQGILYAGVVAALVAIRRHQHQHAPM